MSTRALGERQAISHIRNVSVCHNATALQLCGCQQRLRVSETDIRHTWCVRMRKRVCTREWRCVGVAGCHTGPAAQLHTNTASAVTACARPSDAQTRTLACVTLRVHIIHELQHTANRSSRPASAYGAEASSRVRGVCASQVMICRVFECNCYRVISV